MAFVRKTLNILGAILKTFRLALPKLGVGWMFALLTINFNRITIFELQVTAVAVTGMLAMHYFLSPFQVISGRIADRYPIFGLRRTPYFLMAAVVASLAFLGLPTAAQGMGAGSPAGFALGFALLLIFGVSIAVMGDSHHSLIAEVTKSEHRGSVISVVWTFTILSTIVAAGVMSSVMPEYTPAAMQRLYNLTPFIVLGSAVLGLIGMEPRLKGQKLQDTIDASRAISEGANPVAAAVNVLRTNRQAWGFFAFVFVSIFSIFLQDNILEPFGGEVFGLGLQETNKFQPMWGGGVLIGMMAMGLITAFFNIPKRWIAVVGCVGTSIGMIGLATAAFNQQVGWVMPSLIMMGLFTGFYNVGALSMMMDMTIEGATGLYMGLWGMAQAFGNGASSVAGGALHTGLIGTEFLTPSSAYFFIFGLEAVGMAAAAFIVWHLSVTAFHDQHANVLKREDTLRAMEAGAVA
jgi:MFS transporter, BCD family, chlorophyll transporter